MDRQFIKMCIDWNWYFSDWIRRTTGYFYNKKMLEYIDNISRIDSIQNIEELEEALQTIPKPWHGTFYTLKRVYSENTLYGYAKQLLEYAELPIEDIFYMPLLQHGIPYLTDLAPDTLNLRSAYIFQGRAGQEIYRKKSKRKDYYIGPFIHYSENYYSIDKIFAIKKKMGRTALVFMPHTIEFSDFSIHVDSVINKYVSISNKNIDTVLVCIYYADLNKKVINYIRQEKDFKLVSAGFKLDDLFVKRLKTIIQLSDVVFYDSFSSSIGYAYYMGKNIICGINQREIEEGNFTEKGKEKLGMFYKSFNPYDGKEDIKKIFIEKYWGVSEIKTPKQIREIIMENKNRITKKFGF